MAFDLKAALGAGTDNISKDVLGTPLINIIQRGSPEVDETHPDHSSKSIEGAKAGNIVFAPTRTILPTPCNMIPLEQAECYVEWRPRSAGGGIVAHHPDTIREQRGYRKGGPDPERDKYKEYFGSNELSWTHYFAVLFDKDGEGSWTKGLIAFTGGQLKYARHWAKQLLLLRYPDMPDDMPPIFAAKWAISTKIDKNTRDESYFSWNIGAPVLLDLDTDQALLEQAFSEHQSAKEALPSSRSIEALPESTSRAEDTATKAAAEVF